MSAHTAEEYRAELIEQLVASIEGIAARRALAATLTARIDTAIAVQNSRGRIVDLEPFITGVDSAVRQVAHQVQIRMSQLTEEAAP